ncbi:Cilia- and flagella-associated protein 36 [Acipenser ruthenus]|uniref:Cilia-and flagella-associated protein 36 n=1 Tax=Acipenser ruthenus TaxID=7906 RepID=A0A444U943_ACIRT|nr:Cilia- and flagella-associated protein 36 [Acipenser ruthenus]
MDEDNEWVVETIAGYLGSPDWVIPVTDFIEHKCTGIPPLALIAAVIRQQTNIMQSKNKPLASLQKLPGRSKDEYEQDLAKKRFSEEESGSASNGSSRESKDQQETCLRKHSEKESEQTQKVCKAPVKTVEKGAAVCASHTDDARKKSPTKVCMQPSAKLLPGRSSIGSTCANSKVLAPVKVPVNGSELCPASTSLDHKKSSSEAAEAWLEEARKEAGISRPFTELSADQQEQLQQRAEYLKQQRDKLLAMKKEQRPKPTHTEPAAELSILTSESKQVISEDEKKKIQKRKNLAEKLKQEVIKK